MKSLGFPALETQQAVDAHKLSSGRALWAVPGAQSSLQKGRPKRPRYKDSNRGAESGGKGTEAF